MTWIDVPALDAVLLAGSLQRLIPVRSERHVQALHLCWTRTPKRSDPAAHKGEFNVDGQSVPRPVLGAFLDSRFDR